MILVGSWGLGGEFRLPETVRAETVKVTGRECHLSSPQGSSTKQPSWFMTQDDKSLKGLASSSP